MGEVVAVVSQKGGVGKTATAVNLGACLAAIQRRVLILGVDPQAGLSRSFGFEASDSHPGLLDVIRDGAALEDAIYQVNTRLPRLDLVPLNIASSKDEAQFVEILERDPATLAPELERLRPSYDFIFVDCPSRLDIPTLAALTAADSYLVPVQCEYASMATVGRVLRAALEVKRRYNTRLAIFGFLLTMADKRAGFTIKIVQEIRQYFKERVFRTIIPRDPRLAEVPYRQAPVIVYDIECPGSRAYIQLAREILGGGVARTGRQR